MRAMLTSSVPEFTLPKYSSIIFGSVPAAGITVGADTTLTISAKSIRAYRYLGATVT